MKKKYRYLVTTLIGILMFFTIICMKNIFNKKTTTEILHVLTDATFIPGFILFGFGLLTVAYNAGTFDAIVYGFKMFIGKFFRKLPQRKYKTLYEYRVATHEEKSSFADLIIVGIAFIVISLIFLIIYFKTLN